MKKFLAMMAVGVMILPACSFKKKAEVPPPVEEGMVEGEPEGVAEGQGGMQVQPSPAPEGTPAAPTPPEAGQQPAQ